MIEDVAARLREAERTRIAIGSVRRELGELSIDKAYQVQAANTRQRIRAGERLRGRKIGLTSPAVQRQLGVDQPDFGMLFDRMECAEGGEIALHELVQPKIEAEIAFVLRRDLDHPAPRQQDVLAATDYVLASLEIVDSRIANWDIGIVDTVADNASSARFVLGSAPRRLTDFDFILCGMVLHENGAVKATGAGAASLGNPVEAVRWLAEKLAATDYPLRAGDIVLSGALGPMVSLKAGAHYCAVIGGLGSVTINCVGPSP